MNKVAQMSQIGAKVADANRIDPLEWETRVDLAACYRLVDHFGMTDLHLNHISARVPGEEEHFLINPFGMMYEEITASSLIKVDHAGNIISNANPEYSVNLAGYVIHSAIHGARHDVKCEHAPCRRRGWWVGKNCREARSPAILICFSFLAMKISTPLT